MKTTLRDRMAIMRQVRQAIRQPYAWPGGYPLSIITQDGGVICPDCAKENHRGIAHDTLHPGWEGCGWSAAAVNILWEGGNHCDHCGRCVDAYPDEETASA
jgi:polyferredoxin